MENLSRFLERNSHRFEPDKGVLYFNPPAQTKLAGVDPATGSSLVFCQDYASWRAFHDAGASAEFGVLPRTPARGWPSIVLSLPRERELREALCRWCSGALSEHGVLWVAGENRAGIKSANALLHTSFREVSKQDSARHCVLYRAQEPLLRGIVDEQDLMTEWSFSIADHDYRACSAPGVFAHGHLDPASRLLLESIRALHFSGRVLDFGCGAGVLSAVLGSWNPDLELSLIDSNALALASSRCTLAANDVRGAVYASDGLGEVEGRYDLVISNPPFHQGVHTKSGMSMAMLGSIRNFLKPRGQLILVANRHLPYGAWMNDVFGSHSVLAADNQYQVLRGST